jgi:hypothetical protein
MEQLALRYPVKADLKEALVPDFHSFRQALNVASADQRVLVLIYAPHDAGQARRKSLCAVANDDGIIGRFHFDFDHETKWQESIDGSSDETGIYLINPGEFGLSGQVMKRLPLDTPNDQVIAALTTANQKFASSAIKKDYSTHVRKGRSQGIYFEGGVPYGEDIDGDGEIDEGRGGRRRRGRGR